MSAAPKSHHVVIDLTFSDSDEDSESEGEATPTPAMYRKPRTLHTASGVDVRGLRDQPIPIRASPNTRADAVPGTPSNGSKWHAINTPPTSRRTRDFSAQKRKRQRTRSASPSASASRTAKKRARANGATLATPPSTAEAPQAPDASPGKTRASPHPSATLSPTAQRAGAAPPLHPRPVARRAQHHDGHTTADASVFSPKPFRWQEWSAKDYLELSDALHDSFDVARFARQLSAQPGHRRVTAEEASWVFRAAVARPLRLLEASRQRGKRGMQELRAYFEEHGTEIRWWGGGRVVRGELLGLEAGGVVLALATTPYGKAEQDARKWGGEDLIIDAGKGTANLSLRLLCQDDVDYLMSTLAGDDVDVFAEWWREIAAGRRAAGGRKDKGRASAGY